MRAMLSNQQWTFPPRIRRRRLQSHADLDAEKIDTNAGIKFHLRGGSGSHGEERLERRPNATCEHHAKGFARKYDKSRHAPTNCKSNMGLRFRPGSSAPAEKLFNRADVFKRHPMRVHGPEQGQHGQPAGHCEHDRCVQAPSVGIMVLPSRRGLLVYQENNLQAGPLVTPRGLLASAISWLREKCVRLPLMPMVGVLGHF
ncbi:hypothetical protein B0T14DRAFT_498781 [Immersiella caudata]|uniref:Uncharacterized protein n=1 Tax=Immersiella caudata TaxID=314043 RepID=A0AA40BTM1_9PEZI|nr:hypothetical protein B0T14DRAFT_498781 [Immersiella caudata]